MKVLILEDNLLWSERLRRGCETLGHEATVITKPEPDLLPSADAAILNLGNGHWPLDRIVAVLRNQGTWVVAHAGHKEKELLELGRQIQVDRLATNGELAKKLDRILAQAPH